MHELDKYPGAARWVKVLAAAAILLILIFVLLQLSGLRGEHGPGRHAESTTQVESTPDSQHVIQNQHVQPKGEHVPPEGGHEASSEQ